MRAPVLFPTQPSGQSLDRTSLSVNQHCFLSEKQFKQAISSFFDLYDCTYKTVVALMLPLVLRGPVSTKKVTGARKVVGSIPVGDTFFLSQTLVTTETYIFQFLKPNSPY